MTINGVIGKPQILNLPSFTTSVIDLYPAGVYISGTFLASTRASLKLLLEIIVRHWGLQPESPLVEVSN